MNTQPLGARTDMKPATFLTWLTGATLLALVLRVLLLDRPSFWIDEIYSVMHAARLGEGNITKQFGFVPTFVALKIAGALPSAAEAMDPSSWAAGGVTERLVRLPSVVIGVLTIPILGWLARPVVGARAAVFFAFLLAVSTWHLHMSQTGRFYAQQMLFFNMAMLLYVQARLFVSTGRLVASMVCLFAAFMSQPPAILLGVVLGVDWLIGVRAGDDRRHVVRAAVVGGVTAALCAGLLAFDMTRNTENWAQFGRTTSQSAPVIVAGAIWYMNPVVVIATFAGFLCLLARQARLAFYLGMSALVPLLVMAALAWSEAFVHTRYTFVILPAWLLLAGVALERSSRRSLGEYPVFLRAVPMAMALMASLYENVTYYTAGGGFQPAWREAFADLDAMRKPGEVIYGDFHAELLGAYYMREKAVVTKATRQSLAAELDAATEPCWIVDKVGTSGGLNWPMLRDRADLIWMYDRHVIQPYSSIKIFRYTPPASE